MDTPPDSISVLSAIRLGWYVAETRGRNRPGGPDPLSSKAPSRDQHQLPLRIERSPIELRIECQDVVAALSKPILGDSWETLFSGVDDAAKALEVAKKANSPDTIKRCWNAFAENIYDLDKTLQDMLTAQSEAQACGYQFGRGLAECYWALDLEPPQQSGKPPTFQSWTFLLGESRCDELTRLAGRLTAYFMPYTSTAIAGTLVVWHLIAETPAWRASSDAGTALYDQIRRWFELVVLLQDPKTLVKPYAVLRNYKAAWRSINAFLPQLFFAVGSLALVAWFIYLLNTSQGDALGKSVLGVIAALGISTATIGSYLKNAAQSILYRVKQDAYGDLIAAEMTIAPRQPVNGLKLAGSEDRKRDRSVSRAVKARTLTTSA